MTRYELLDRIGVGGMAEIFRGKAVAAGGFEKPVAIKRILPHLSQDKRFVELLIAEAKVLSLLKHRNIVQIFDVGLGDDGQYFLVMEFVDGKDLGALQRAMETERLRIPFDLALHIGAEICEALEHAHSARAPDGKPMSLVHRDVSPSNVLVSRAGEIKLTDFGIAKRAESEQTGHGAVRGKFAYISPEQARNEHIDPRSDVFSVAVLVWELVTGKRLFSGLGDLEALRAVREAQARRPTEADPRLDAAIDTLLMPALSKDAKRRPTAAQLGEQLRSLRYSLDATVGDPATELAKIIDNAEAVAKAGGALDEHTSATVIRIHTADAFAGGADVAKARQVIHRFEEEETRLAQVSGDQLRQLRAGAPADRDSDLGTSPGPRTRKASPTDEPTRAATPLDDLDGMTVAQDPSAAALAELMRDDADEHTRLVAPSSRRTPAPERVVPRAATSPTVGTPITRPRAVTSTPGPSSTRSRAATNTPASGTRDAASDRGPVSERSAASDRGPSSERRRAAQAAASDARPPLPPSNGRVQPPGDPRAVPPPSSDARPTIPSSGMRGAPASDARPPLPPSPVRGPSPSDARPPQLNTPGAYSPPGAPQAPMHLEPSGAAPMPQAPFPPGAPHAPMHLEPSGAAPMPQPPFAAAPQAPMHLDPSGAAPLPRPGQFPPPGPPGAPQLPALPWAGPPAPMYPQHPPPRAGLQPWMLVIGALVMALIAFAVTRALIG